MHFFREEFSDVGGDGVVFGGRCGSDPSASVVVASVVSDAALTPSRRGQLDGLRGTFR